MLRKTVSLTALLSFTLLMATSVALYILPAGRVAYWANYRLLGLSKTDWDNLHLNLGVLLFITIVLHSLLNWKPLVAYLQSRSRNFRLFTAEFNLALLLTLVFAGGTLLELPPFSSITRLGAALSADANSYYGEPPYGHAELSTLQTFAKKMELDLKLSRQRLQEAGVLVIDSGQTLQEIAADNGLPPKELYAIISPPAERAKTFPKQPPAGLGKRPLIELCQDYSVNIRSVLEILAAQGIKANENMSIKEIATEAGKDPFSVYELIRDGLQASS